MRQAANAQTEIPTISQQPPRGEVAGLAGRAKKTGAHARAKVLGTGTERESTRGGGEVIELERGITVYPPGPKVAGGVRSRRVCASTRRCITALPACAARARSKSPLIGPQAYHPRRRVTLSRTAQGSRERVVATEMVFPAAAAVHTPQLGRRR
jgi:hypothetical protein